ncbi:siderophore-interacting protein [Empedobacter brevis]|uniref:siderophore-interacting protein n=1 Tax=Empedobacter brevis TaxID=247 RepID=UPI002FE2C663
MSNDIPTKKIQSVFTVKRKEFITPHLIRVVFKISDEQIGLLPMIQEGANNKIFIPPKNIGLIYFPEKNLEHKTTLTAVIRTYTNRKIDFQKKELTIDFVVHGENGPASAWAIHAQPGDPLGIEMKQNNKPLVPKADRYLFVGDATALPAISAILEHLPAGVQVDAVLEVYSKEDEMLLCTAANLEIEWLHNPNPEKGSKLSEKVQMFDFSNFNQKSYIYIAAEYSIVKELRHYFRQDLQWNQHLIYTCSYWKAGTSEDEEGIKR